jgi:hypothetical protein
MRKIEKGWLAECAFIFSNHLTPTNFHRTLRSMPTGNCTFRKRGILLSLMPLCLCAKVAFAHSQLPVEVPINPTAGRGDCLIVTLRLQDGEDLPLMVDTGTSGTLIDKSLASKLGKPLGTQTYQSWGVVSTYKIYAPPRLYLGDTQLIMTNPITAYDAKKYFSDESQPVLGILGMDVLQHYCVQFDFSAGKMRLLDGQKADKRQWGEAFPILPLDAHDDRPSVAQNLLGQRGPHSLIDSGCISDGWLMPRSYEQWTNRADPPPSGESHSPNGIFDGKKYPLVILEMNNVESDGIGLRFLARHLVTLDFPNHTLYLKRQSMGPLPDPTQKTTPMEALDPLVNAIILEDTNAARTALTQIDHGPATAFEKKVAETLEATLEDKPRPAPADLAPSVTEVKLGDCHPELAEVGWLVPSANRIPLNAEIESPLLDSGQIYATGLFAHAPSRYVFNLGGKWTRLRGEAGLHTTFQGLAWGVVFIIKADGKQVFRSAVIHASEHPRYDLNVAGVKTLALIVEKAQKQNGGNWGLWLDPTLFR